MTIDYFFILSSRGFYSHCVRRIVHCLCITAGVHLRASFGGGNTQIGMHDRIQGAASIFIKTLLDKKYPLPVLVIQSIIGHFVRFQTSLMWSCRCCGIRHYWRLYNGTRMRWVWLEGKGQLRDLMKVHSHPKITVEVRRELFGSAA